MKRSLWLMVLVLVLLHQDYWQWGNATLIFGFLPYSLAYHAALSLLAAAVWWAATQFFWPTELEVAAEPPTTRHPTAGKASAQPPAPASRKPGPNSPDASPSPRS